MTQNPNKEPQILICECNSVEHQIIIRKDAEDDGERIIYLSVYLTTHRSFFKRVWVSLKYIFGYKCRYGQWDEIIVTRLNYRPLKDAVEYLETTRN